MNLFAIFINYNSGDQLFNGVKKVIKSPSVSGIVIVDNGSKDKSLEMIPSIVTSKVIIVKRNGANLGFYKGLNIAVKTALRAGADCVMPLDFDLDFDFDFITRLSKVDADMVAPALKSKMNGRWFYDYGGRINFLLGKCYHNIKYRKVKDMGIKISVVDRADSDWIDFISGGCTIIRKKVFEKIGYFDEDYFVYFGDTDFALSARNGGFKVAMDGNTVVHHKLEITSQSKNFRKMKIALLDNITFIRKRVHWYFWPLSFVNLLAHCVQVAFRVIRV